jgi:hypothetical protein
MLMGALQGAVLGVCGALVLLILFKRFGGGGTKP